MDCFSSYHYYHYLEDTHTERFMLVNPNSEDKRKANIFAMDLVKKGRLKLLSFKN